MFWTELTPLTFICLNHWYQAGSRSSHLPPNFFQMGLLHPILCKTVENPKTRINCRDIHYLRTTCGGSLWKVHVYNRGIWTKKKFTGSPSNVLLAAVAVGDWKKIKTDAFRSTDVLVKPKVKLVILIKIRFLLRSVSWAYTVHFIKG